MGVVQVILLGSDALGHPFLCKPKHNLRKDARIMEFTTMINHLLSKDPKSRRRKLYIRRFAVLPLTEDSGMIECVLHMRGLQHILQDIYMAAGIDTNASKHTPILRSQCDKFIKSTKLLPLHPGIEKYYSLCLKQVQS